MILSRKLPTIARALALLEAQQGSPFSYPATRATRTGDAPPGFDADQASCELGRGERAFRAACAAVREWRMFDFGWARALLPATRIAAGELQAISTRQLGMWTLCACRIVYVIDEERRFGFAYGTLREHVERGEELFLVEWLADDSVRYTIRAFSRPRNALVWCVRPYVRVLQARFRRESCAAMARAAGEGTGPGPESLTRT